MKNLPWVLVSNNLLRTKGTSLLVSDYWFYYLVLHIRFASVSRFSQLVEIFAYENTTTSSTGSFNEPSRVSTVTVIYHFHNLFTQDRLFLFVSDLSFTNSTNLKTLGEVFTTSQWLERELSEMYGLCFRGKKDLRNLMLQYGDSSTPFRKVYPSVGLSELVYDTVTDTLVHTPTSTQI
jgi:NADH:ubiquinone oxidoreductase subunit C